MRKLGLFSLCTVALSGCMVESKPSFTSEAETSQEVVQEVLPIVKVECWYRGDGVMSHNLKFIGINNSVRGKVGELATNFDLYLPDKDGYITLSVNKCAVTFY